MTFDEFTEEFKILIEVYGHNSTPLMCVGYYEVLKDLTVKEFKDAVIKILKSNKYFPKPVEIIDAIKPKDEQYVPYASKDIAKYLTY